MRIAMRLARQFTGALEPEQAHVGELSVTLVAAMRLSQLFVASGHVEDVVDDLEQDAQLVGKTAIRDCLRFAQSSEAQYDAVAGCVQAPRLYPLQPAQVVGP